MDIETTPASEDPTPNQHTQFSAEEFLDQFTTDPHLAVRDIVNAARRAVLGAPGDPGYDPTLEPGYWRDAESASHHSDAAIEGVKELGRSLGGRPTPPKRKTRRRSPRLTGPITYNKTSNPAKVDVFASPARSERAWLLAAERLTHDILAVGLPDDLAAQTNTFAVLTEPVKATFVHAGLDRRGASIMEAAARHLVHHTQPDGLRFVTTAELRRWHADQVDAHADANAQTQRSPGTGSDNRTAETDNAAEDRGASSTARPAGLLRRPRIAWTHPEGIGHGLLIDRLHHTSLRGLIDIDGWVRRRAARDLADVDAFLRSASGVGGPGDGTILGIRVLAHRAPNTGAHFLPAYVDGRTVLGDHHGIGDCDICATRPVLPNSRRDIDGEAQR